MPVDLRLGLLVCDKPAPRVMAVHGDYEQIFTRLRIDTPENPNIPLTSIHVLTVQGHPQFKPSFMLMTIDARAGILGEALANDARSRAAGISERHHPDGLACDGVGRIGKAIWGVLGVI